MSALRLYALLEDREPSSQRADRNCGWKLHRDAAARAEGLIPITSKMRLGGDAFRLAGPLTVGSWHILPVRLLGSKSGRNWGTADERYCSWRAPLFGQVTPYRAAQLAARRSRRGRKPASPPIPVTVVAAGARGTVTAIPPTGVPVGRAVVQACGTRAPKCSKGS